MKKITEKQAFLLFVSFIIIPVIVIASIFNWNNEDSKTFTIKNNSTRNYVFEHYCDSIYEVNPDYYFDVLVETDEYQSYIEEHGEWWTN